MDVKRRVIVVEMGMVYFQMRFDIHTHYSPLDGIRYSTTRTLTALLCRTILCLVCFIFLDSSLQVRIRHTFVLEDEFPDPPPMAELVPPESPDREVPLQETVRQRIPYEEGTEEDTQVIRRMGL